METENDRDLVILCPQWLCNTLIGRVLSLPAQDWCSQDSTNNKHIDHVSANTLAELFPESAEDDISNIIRVIESLDLCYRFVYIVYKIYYI